MVMLPAWRRPLAGHSGLGQNTVCGSTGTAPPSRFASDRVCQWTSFRSNLHLTTIEWSRTILRLVLGNPPVFDTLVWPTSMISNGPPAMTKSGTLGVIKAHQGDRCEGEKRAWTSSKLFDGSTSSGL